jgi:hypothetical protein
MSNTNKSKTDKPRESPVAIEFFRDKEVGAYRNAEDMAMYLSLQEALNVNDGNIDAFAAAIAPFVCKDIRFGDASLACSAYNDNSNNHEIVGGIIIKGLRVKIKGLRVKEEDEPTRKFVV